MTGFVKDQIRGKVWSIGDAIIGSLDNKVWLKTDADLWTYITDRIEDRVGDLVHVQVLAELRKEKKQDEKETIFIS